MMRVQTRNALVEYGIYTGDLLRLTLEELKFNGRLQKRTHTNRIGYI